MNIDQHTALYGVVGYPIAHSLSPTMHNTGFSAIGLNAITARLPLAAPGDGAEITLSGELRDTGRSARFSPITIDLKGERAGETILFGGEIAGAEGALRLPIKGSANLTQMTGRLDAGPQSLASLRPFDGVHSGIGPAPIDDHLVPAGQIVAISLLHLHA